MNKLIECIDQGDVRFIPVPKGTKIPGMKPAAKHKTVIGAESTEAYIVAHSETGHHHVVRTAEAVMYESENPFLALLELPSKALDEGAKAFAEIVNLRDLRPHAPAQLDARFDYIVSRQTEWQPEALRSAAD